MSVDLPTPRGPTTATSGAAYTRSAEYAVHSPSLQSVSPDAHGAPTTSSAHAAADAKEMPPPSPRPPASGVSGAHGALQLLEQLALGYRHLCQYKCAEAVEVFQGLPERQRQTGWVLNQLGRVSPPRQDPNLRDPKLRDSRCRDPLPPREASSPGSKPQGSET